MRTIEWITTGVLGVLMLGCAGINTGPTPEARQALAPTDKLRVALQLAIP
jgi:polar amino acid transport system substrate-binding protein